MRIVFAALLRCGLAVPAFAQTPVSAPSAHATPPVLTLDISGFHSDQGSCRVYVFRGAAGFPAETGRAVASVGGIIRGGRCRVQVPALAPGEYAASVVHDENGNGRLDTNLFGMPKEGLGTSNNPAAAGGPPRFRAARFAVSQAPLTLPIAVRYL